ncbi:MAG: hypothetical protein ACK4IT_04590 [Thioalkalivibrionaceae bacterium]
MLRVVRVLGSVGSLLRVSPWPVAGARPAVTAQFLTQRHSWVGGALVLVLSVLSVGCAGGLDERVRPSSPVPSDPVAAGAASQVSSTAEAQILSLIENGDFAAARERLEARRAAQANDALAARYLPALAPDLRARLGEPVGKTAVQVGESLSVIAARELGDPRHFALLARYNEVAVPRRIQAGQMLDLPDVNRVNALLGRAPVVARPDVRGAPARRESTVPGQESAADPRAFETETTGAMTRDRRVRDDALGRGAPSEALGTMTTPEVTFAEQNVEALHAQAVLAFRNQELDTAIGLWDRVLERDPEHDGARAYRARAVDLRARVEQFPLQSAPLQNP